MASWYDLMVGEEERKSDAYVRMTASQWKTEAQQIIRSWTGDLRACINYLDEMDAKRATVATVPQPVASPVSEEERTWRVWMDMVEEPEKYGSDIGEWMEVDEQVRVGPKRWRANAFWLGKVREQEEAETAAATKIQALWRGVKTRGLVAPCEDAAAVKVQGLWRGHVTRQVFGERFNCGRCLAHGVCIHYLSDDDMWVCGDCKTEVDRLWVALGDELEATREEEDDAVQPCGDCGEEVFVYGAQVGEMWLCPECVHEWTACTRCDHAIHDGARCDNHCLGCGDRLEDTCLGAFCCSDCRSDYNRDACQVER